MTQIVLGAASLAVVIIAWATYLATVPSGNVPVRPVGTVLLQLTGIGLATGAMMVGVSSSVQVAAVVPSTFAIVLGGMFILLLSLAKTPKNDLQVEVGKPLPSFHAHTDTGEPFDTASLGGQRTLLKFFRGGW